MIIPKSSSNKKKKRKKKKRKKKKLYNLMVAFAAPRLERKKTKHPKTEATPQSQGMNKPSRKTRKKTWSKKTERRVVIRD